MTPDERQELKDLREIVTNIRTGADPEFIQAMKRFAVGSTLSVVNANADPSSINTTADSGAGTVDVAKDFDAKIIIQDADGNQYSLGRYN